MFSTVLASALTAYTHQSSLTLVLRILCVIKISRVDGHSGLSYFVPLLVIIASNLVIGERIVQSARQRAAIASTPASDREVKATCMLVVMSVILFIVPHVTVTSVLALSELPFVPYLMLVTYDMTVNLYTLTLLRCLQVVVYFIMIREFRDRPPVLAGDALGRPVRL